MSDSEEEQEVKQRKTVRQEEDDDDDDDEESRPKSRGADEGEDGEEEGGEGGDDDEDDDEDNDEDGEVDDAPKDKGKKRKGSSSPRGRDNKKRRRKKRGTRLLDDEAAVGGEDDEDEELEDGEELTEREAERLTAEQLYNKPRTKTAFENLLQRKDSEIEQHYKQRARDTIVRTQEFYEDGVGGRPSALTRKSLLPTPGVDPSMWRVKVKKNQEQALVMALMDMARCLTAKGQRVGFTSAVFAGTKGYVLIEARNEADAAEAVRANARFLLSQRLEVLNHRYMPTSLAVSERIAPKPISMNQWVRIKRGLYKGDLSRVIAIIEGGSRVLVEIVPRLNYDEMARNTKAGNIFIMSSHSRPSQKFFSASEAKEHGVDLHRSKLNSIGQMCDVANGLFYLNGYLVKEVRPEALQTETVNATVEEVTKFGTGAMRSKDQPDGNVEESMELAQRAVEETLQSQRKLLRVFEQGDVVKVIGGELRNLVARVLSTDPMAGTVSIQPKNPGLGLPDKIDMPSSQLANHVEIGQHIKVMDGMFAGETGMVQAILEDPSRRDAEPVISILTDGENKEIRVRQGQVKESAEVAMGLNSLQGYKTHDLVQFGYQKFGVITWLGRESVQVIDSAGVMHTVPVGELQGNFNRRSTEATTTDAVGQRVRVGDTVLVTERGEHMKKQGQIKHILKATLWVHSKQESRNSGIFVVRRDCVQLQNLMRRPTAVYNVSQQQSFQQPSHGSGGRGGFGGGRGGFGGGRGGRGMQDPLLGKTVKIKGRSDFKGHTGIVKNVKDNKVFVMVTTGTVPRTVPVERACVELESDVTAGGRGPADTGYNAPATPWLHPRTPAHVAQTPMLGAQTPAYGMQTPAYGSQTPAYGGQTPRQGSQTPRRDGGTTPMYDNSGW